MFPVRVCVFLSMQAPQFIGNVVGTLVQLQVCPLQSIQDMVVVMSKSAIGEQSEFDPPAELVHSAYRAFLTAVERKP